MDAECLADGTLPAMSQRLRFKGGILPPLIFIQCLKKSFLEIKIFDVHYTSINDSTKIGSYFLNFS
jgi:hypothetical protein